MTMEIAVSSRPRTPQTTKLAAGDWEKLRAARLKALQESSDKFLSNFEREAGYEEKYWAAEFDRGHWWIQETPCEGEGRPNSITGLIGATRDAEQSKHQWYLEYIWVDPDLRRKGFAQKLIWNAIGYLAAADDEAIISLWVIDGNDAAYNLYDQLGFRYENIKKSLNDGTDRKEILMKLG